MNQQQQSINNSNRQSNQKNDETDSVNVLMSRSLHEIDQFVSTTKRPNSVTKSQLNSRENETEAMKSNIPGILKNSKSLKIDDTTAAGGGGQASPSSISSKPSQPTSYYFEGREIVVLDDEFVNEKTKNQNDVTIIKNNDHMEFVQALGTKWPDEAGPVSEILNNDSSKCKTYTFNVKHDRNKSPNPLSHIGSRNKKRNSSESGYGSASHKGIFLIIIISNVSFTI